MFFIKHALLLVYCEFCVNKLLNYCSLLIKKIVVKWLSKMQNKIMHMYKYKTNKNKKTDNILTLGGL